MFTVNRVQQVRIGDSSLWILKAGRTAIFCGLKGRDFYKQIQPIVAEIFTECNVDRIIVEIPQAHYRLLRTKLKDLHIVKVCEFEYGGVRLSEIELRLKT